MKIAKRNDLDSLFDLVLSQSFVEKKVTNLPVQIKEAARRPNAVNNLRNLLASVDRELTGEDLLAYSDISILNQEIDLFVKASRDYSVTQDFYFSYYLSSGNAAIYVFRKNKRFETELRILKDKKEYDFSNVKEKFGIKKSDSRKNVNSYSLKRALFPINRKCYPGEFLYFLSDFDEIMTGRRLESYSFKALEALIPAMGRFMEDANLGHETQVTFKLSNGINTFIKVNSASQIRVGFLGDNNSELMEKLTRQFV